LVRRGGSWRCCWARPRGGSVIGPPGWRLAVLLGKTARRRSHWSAGWRLAVLLGKSAHRSESLRTRLGGRLAAAFGGCLKSNAGLRRAPQRGGRLRSDCGAAVRGGSALFTSLRTGRGCGGGRRLVLWSPSVLCPTPRMRLTEADRSGGIKPDHTLLWSSRVRPDTTGPACLGKPRIRGVGPRTQHPCVVRRIHRTTWLGHVAWRRQLFEAAPKLSRPRIRYLWGWPAYTGGTMLCRPPMAGFPGRTPCRGDGRVARG